jgi:hypothetical protein
VVFSHSFGVIVGDSETALRGMTLVADDIGSVFTQNRGQSDALMTRVDDLGDPACFLRINEQR